MLAWLLPPCCMAPRQGCNWTFKHTGKFHCRFSADDFFPSFSLMHECFLLFLLSINPLNCDLVRNAVCRQTARIDFPEVGWPNDECIGKQHTLAYLLFYIKLVFWMKYPNIFIKIALKKNYGLLLICIASMVHVVAQQHLLLLEAFW